MAREQRSLFGEILDWMLAPLLLLWPASVALTWLVAQNIANSPYDRALGESARVIAQRVQFVQAGDGQPTQLSFNAPSGTQPLLRTDETDEFAFQVLGTRGEFLDGERFLPVPPEEIKPVPGELNFRDDELRGERVRVAWVSVASPPGSGLASPVVQVAETLGKRSRLATEIIKGVILPQFVILPMAVLLVWMALARGIAPLNELQERIRQRASDDLSPIDEHDAPEEVGPLVQAINDLLARLSGSLATQKRFLADAAHQLKTPLAGLRMQAELAQRELEGGGIDATALATSLRQISRSTQRATRMVNQLLAMARAEDDTQSLRMQTVDMSRLATDTVQDFVPRALERQIDLGYEGPTSSDASPAQVLGHRLLLREMISNLVDNALHYTPSGGAVTVRLVADPFGQVVVLQVEDTGPGIPAAERDLVLQPFYRALGTNVDGSGLGLAIVREIARQHGAELTISDTRSATSSETPGACFTVRFTSHGANPPNTPANEV